ncbi:MAG: Gfo/Idh/MocA family oxidoreductase [Candidatus Zixiibacteriota bacterium]|nr:MAG: Gfo/Idh/MocA family oxidoreductase [candidate division Zixibacteria bacterium]
MPALRTAVVGVGALGRHHLRWLSELDGSNLVGLYDIDRQKAEKYAGEYKIRAFDDLEQLAQAAQAVSVVVPTTAHFDIASLLIEKGIHCLIEKPVTLSVEQAAALGKMARDKHVKVTVGQIESFNPAVRALGEYDINPAFIEAHRLAPFDPRGTDVAVVLDLMIHDIDLVLMLIKSDIVDIQASSVAVVSEQVDIANARVTFASGAVANLTASRISLNPMRKLRIFQRSGYFSLDLAARQADIYRLAGGDEPVDGFRVPLGKSGQDIVYVKKEDDGQDMLAAEIDAFLTAVVQDGPVAVTVERATEALRVALEIEKIGKESLARMMTANLA